MKLFLALMLSATLLFSYSSNIKQARAIGIFDEKGNGENIQHLRQTKYDYNGTCFIKVFVEGTLHNEKPQVTIKNSRGHFQNSETVFSKQNVKIGTVFLYKIYNVTNGYISVKIGNKIYDKKVFVK